MTALHYHDFDLQIDQLADASYRARVLKMNEARNFGSKLYQAVFQRVLQALPCNLLISNL